MSTRAVYTFSDGTDTFHVYKHSDGYPSGAAEAIANAFPHAWPLPRFEADEFAAGFVAGNKLSEKQTAQKYREKALEAQMSGNTDRERFCLETAQDYETGRYRHFSGGDIRLVRHWKRCGDLSYRYEIKPTKKAGLQITAYSANGFGEQDYKLIFKGTLEQFASWANEYKSR